MAKGEVNRGWFVTIGSYKTRIKEDEYNQIKDGRDLCIIKVDLIGTRTYKTIVILDEGERVNVECDLINEGYTQNGRTFVKRADEIIEFNE